MSVARPQPCRYDDRSEALPPGPDQACLRCYRADQRNLQLERCAADSLLKLRLNGRPHATIEKRCHEATVHGAPGIEVSRCRHNRDDDATALSLYDIVAQRLRGGTEGQRSAGKALNELKPAHLFLPLWTDLPISS